jgi:hypothetical protein
MNHICTDVSLWRLPYGFSTKTQKPGALILLYTSRLSSGSAVLVEAEPGVAWNPYPLDCDASSCMRLCTYARLISLSLLLISLCLSLCTARVSWPPASALRLLHATTASCVRRIESSHLPGRMRSASVVHAGLGP